MIFVLIFWLSQAGGIDHIQAVARAQTADVCRNANLAEIVSHADDAQAQLAKGLSPHLACAIAVPDHAAPAPAPQKESDRCNSPMADEVIQGCKRYNIRF